MKIEIKQYTKDLYNEVINLNLKKEDVNEVEKLSGKSVKEHLIEATDLYSDYILLIYYNNKVEGLFGVIPCIDDNKIGVGFFLTTDNIKHFKRDIVKYTREGVEFFLKQFNIIFNYVPKNYTVSINWLAKNGAIFEEEEFDFNGEIFKRFYFTQY